MARHWGTSDRARDGRLPDAPDSISTIGCNATNGTYFQLYSDERGVCRSAPHPTDLLRRTQGELTVAVIGVVPGDALC